MKTNQKPVTIPCHKFIALVNDSGSYRGTMCCYCGEVESLHKPASDVKARLEYLRGELRAESISWGELAELESLAPYIANDDVELLEAAGVPENTR